jgi:hypothetical protein
LLYYQHDPRICCVTIARYGRHDSLSC